MKKRIVFDIKAWLVVLLLMPLGVHTNSHTERLQICLSFWLILIAGFYPHQWLIERCLKRRKWVAYTAGLLLLLTILGALTQFVLHLVGGMPEVSYLAMLQTMALFLFFSTAISYAYKGIWLQIQYEKTRRRQVEAELQLLQSQVNPHFLFNTLNNIYAQNLSSPDDANEMILQLADLMRYQTESSRKSSVALLEEIQFLHNYIALEKKRLNANTAVLFQTDIPEDAQYLIPPMLFIPFVENAFKHGIGVEAGNFIHISLSVKEEKLIFSLNNSLPKRKRTVTSTQTGLDNIKKRLELLFPDQYELHITNTDNTYHTQLTLLVTG